MSARSSANIDDHRHLPLRLVGGKWKAFVEIPATTPASGNCMNTPRQAGPRQVRELPAQCQVNSHIKGFTRSIALSFGDGSSEEERVFEARSMTGLIWICGVCESGLPEDHGDCRGFDLRRWVNDSVISGDRFRSEHRITGIHAAAAGNAPPPSGCSTTHASGLWSSERRRWPGSRERGLAAGGAFDVGSAER